MASGDTPSIVEEKPNTKQGAAAQRAAIGAALVLIAVAVVVYLVYFRQQSAFYTARDLRVVRTMTAALDGRVGVYSGYVKNSVRYNDRSVITVTENCGRKIVDADNAALPAKLDAMPGKEWFARTLVYSGEETFLRIAYYALLPDKKGVTVHRGCSDVANSQIIGPRNNAARMISGT